MDIVDVLGLDSLLAMTILAIGAAMVAGNGFAIIQARRGNAPADATGEFRASRAWWLLAVGAVIFVWGLASILV
ncbi:MAG: hypothetical protein KJN71_09890 [Acidimicrobiia bacterium]|nr:hypothetical protein [Acidimicrobiia bacterium]NNC73922.1 hypothetical protein [Acidimicrobiia bacterium]